MKKAVLISIRPEWCEKIAAGQKTIEVRKTQPKIKTPFKVYIYQTLPKSGDWNERDGRVIGEFICDYIRNVPCGYYHHFLPKRLTAINPHELSNYADGKTLYGWHISDLVIYDKPKKFGAFSKYSDFIKDIRPCKSCELNVFDYNENTKVCEYSFDGEDCPKMKLTRPPQSWCYVEELKWNLMKR